jgi:DNA-binding transcriptional ArsR family regulator
MADKYVLMDLNDEKSKDIATVLNSSASKKILNLLSEKTKLSESDISKELGLPISTVHYNLSVLCKAKLVEAKEYHYSSKGREVNHYSLANKFIIIAPSKMDDSTKDRLKNLFLSITFGVFFIGGGVFSFLKAKSLQAVSSGSGLLTNSAMSDVSTETLRRAPDVIITSGSGLAAGAAEKAAPTIMAEAPSKAAYLTSFVSDPYMLIFLGAVTGIFLLLSTMFLVKFIKAKRISNK